MLFRSDFVKAPVTRRSGSGLIGDQVGRIESISKDLTGASIELGCRVVPRNLVDRGDCRSATSPMMFMEKTPVLADCTWTHDRGKQYQGMESYLFTKTVAAGTACAVTLTDNEDTDDMHGAVPGSTLLLSGRLWVPAGAILGTETLLDIQQYYAAAWHSSTIAGVALYDEWQALELEVAINAAATGFHFGLYVFATAAITEYFWATDIRLDIVE